MSIVIAVQQFLFYRVGEITRIYRRL